MRQLATDFRHAARPLGPRQADHGQRSGVHLVGVMPPGFQGAARGDFVKLESPYSAA